MTSRRLFLRNAGLGVLGSGLGVSAWGEVVPEISHLTILHTNDVHSRLDPFPMDGTRNQGMGGVARRAALIDSIRAEHEQVLLLDSGDIFQGTPYFNFFGGELEFKAMSAMKYDASTIGNHDFDGGLEGLDKHWEHAKFPFVSSNYDFSDTVLHDRIEDYILLQRGNIRIGIFGLGISLEGRVPPKLYGNVQYNDPVAAANRVSRILKRDEKCDYIICLSHLGYRYTDERIDDRKLAASSRDINLILGGHTHTFLMHPEVIADLDGEPVVINQAGWGGIQLGRIDVSFELGRANRCTTCDNLWIT